MRAALLLVAILILPGCSLFGEKIRIVNEPIEVKVPLLYCPAPPEFNRPDLQINQLTDAQKLSDGELVKAYAASMLQLLGYTKELENIVQSYDETNAAYEEVRRKFQAEWSAELEKTSEDE